MRDFIGEFIGVFILVFFGCGSVAVTIIFSAHVGLFQVAFIWGVAVTLAIYASRHLSNAHLNPAVTLAMIISRRMPMRKLPTYLLAQFLGAFIAAGLLYLLFSDSIAHYESINGIIRGEPKSIKTAMFFGEFYPNPANSVIFPISILNAFLAELIGTFFLVFMVFALTEDCNVGKPSIKLAPVFIGLTVTIIICIVAPLTQAGLNPARDLSPRVFSMIAGWKSAALPDKHYGFLIVYVAGPLVGGVLASIIFTKLIQPILDKKIFGD
ncbi:MAG: aquaporin [Spirochaetota bacterium]|nr:aquaporin [Spirochaetota bacterium]